MEKIQSVSVVFLNMQYTELPDFAVLENAWSRAEFFLSSPVAGG